MALKDEILAMIASKIEGQGSAIDAGSALPGILRGLLNRIDEVEGEIPLDAIHGDGLKSIIVLSKSDYDGLTTKDAETLYIVKKQASQEAPVYYMICLGDDKIVDSTPEVGSEAVSVVVRGCEWVSDSENRNAAVAGGKVIVKTFNPATKETKEDEYTIPASGIVEVAIPHRLVYQVHSEVEGLAASFRLVFTSCQDTRTIALWNTSIGVFKYGYNWATKEGVYRGFPFLAKDGSLSEDDANNDWDVHDDEENAEEAGWAGIAIATATSSFLVAPGALALDDNDDPVGLTWSKQAFCKGVPGLPNLYDIYGSEWQDKAKEDFDGGLNTAKIFASFPTAEAATFCAEVAAGLDEYYKNFYLGSAGEMFALYQNREAYASIQEDYTDCPELGTRSYWSSSVYDRWNAALVRFDDGNVGSDYMSSHRYVLALSAFQFDY